MGNIKVVICGECIAMIVKKAVGTRDVSLLSVVVVMVVMQRYGTNRRGLRDYSISSDLQQLWNKMAITCDYIIYNKKEDIAPEYINTTKTPSAVATVFFPLRYTKQSNSHIKSSPVAPPAPSYSTRTSIFKPPPCQPPTQNQPFL